MSNHKSLAHPSIHLTLDNRFVKNPEGFKAVCGLKPLKPHILKPKIILLGNFKHKFRLKSSFSVDMKLCFKKVSNERVVDNLQVISQNYVCALHKFKIPRLFQANGKPKETNHRKPKLEKQR
ncbi:MAG: hypothetical protein N0A00_02810 [Candidatus Bathyarchaeota archaeon]|nr:hypothetical protein [Candidatus Bathyarchaeota archaeon]